MLVQFTVSNYRSIHDPQTLSLVAANLKSKDGSLDEQVVIKQDRNPDLLRTAVMYGANASGKSNLIKALRLMRGLVLNSARSTAATGGIPVEPFRLNRQSVTEPSTFEVVFLIDQIRYRYGFEATEEKVLSEWLYMVPTVREARLFEREGQTFSIGERFKEGRDLAGHTRPNALFLSVAAQLNVQMAQLVLGWFRALTVLGGEEHSEMHEEATLTHLAENGRYTAVIKQLIRDLDLGIENISVDVTEGAPQFHFLENMPEETLQRVLNLFKGASMETFDVQTEHHLLDEEGQVVGKTHFNLFANESDGTQKIFALSLPLLKALDTGGIWVADEFDLRLHPVLTKALIRLFNRAESNPKGAQLIFNTHDVSLLDPALFRRDQIWFVEKDHLAATQLYSLAEFKVRNDKRYAKGYMQGMFGALPYIDELSAVEALADMALE